jgi:NitT/TauT family transport system substrate-binding protein
MPMQSRREFLTNTALAGAAGLGGFGTWGKTLAAEPPPAPAAERQLETTTVRLAKELPDECAGPYFAAEDLLSAEGFTDISYPEIHNTGVVEAAARGAVDFQTSLAFGSLPKAIENGLPIVALAGIHIGCFELFAREGIRHIADLKGKSIGLTGTAPAALLTLMAAWVGLDPSKDFRWVTEASIGDKTLASHAVTDPSTTPLALFVEGKIDACLTGPGEDEEKLRARHAGHVIFNTTTDSPWSQYFCCMLVGNREYVRRYPVATKRVLRAILKAADLCASEPARVARQLVDRGFSDHYDSAFKTLTDIPYSAWRDYDPEDSVRFYALRLRDAGLIKSTPNKLIADGTDWSFLNEIKRELKA